MHRLRVIPWLIGVVLVLTTLVGANRLLHNEPAADGGPPAPKGAPAPATGEVLVAKGTVVSDPPPIPFTLPASMSAGNIAEVFVHNGKEVKVGDPLIRFDDTLLKLDLKKAEDSYNAAAEDYNAAVQKQKDYPLLMEEAQITLKAASTRLEDLKKQLEVVRKDLESVLKATRDKNDVPLLPVEIDRRINEDMRVMLLQSQINGADADVKKADNALKKADAGKATVDNTIRKAAFYATAIKHEMSKIQQAIDDCTQRAKVGGTIEQLTAAVGQTVYPGTRPPLFYLVPGGPRMVSAEVVPDFAHKLKGREGQEVQITDESNLHLIYKGKVKRIGSAFLPKPNAAPDLINGKSNAVLIVDIEVTDSTPTDKAPLRVGQPVRVTFR